MIRCRKTNSWWFTPSGFIPHRKVTLDQYAFNQQIRYLKDTKHLIAYVFAYLTQNCFVEGVKTPTAAALLVIINDWQSRCCGHLGSYGSIQARFIPGLWHGFDCVAAWCDQAFILTPEPKKWSVITMTTTTPDTPAVPTANTNALHLTDEAKLALRGIVGLIIGLAIAGFVILGQDFTVQGVHAETEVATAAVEGEDMGTATALVCSVDPNAVASAEASDEGATYCNKTVTAMDSDATDAATWGIGVAFAAIIALGLIALKTTTVNQAMLATLAAGAVLAWFSVNKYQDSSELFQGASLRWGAATLVTLVVAGVAFFWGSGARVLETNEPAEATATA